MPADDTHLRSDEELQAGQVAELKPHNAPITLVEYDPVWPALFAREAQRISAALGRRALRIVGSTSVPGLCAKPIIDIVLVVEDSADETLISRSWRRSGTACVSGSRTGWSTAC